MSNELSLISGSCQFTPTGLVVAGQPDEAEWLEIGSHLACVVKGLMWCVGDWLLIGETCRYLPRGKLDEACKRFGIEYQTAKNAASVCKTYERSRRRDLLTFGHHEAVAGRPDADELLQAAAENCLTVKQLRDEKRRRQRQEAVTSATKSKHAKGKHGEATWEFKVGSCEALPFENDSFDLVFCSPPYESQRDYGELEFNKSGEEWVEWAVACYKECLRVCRGLVAWVVEGVTTDFAYSSTPFLLLSDLHRAGVKVRKPLVYQRNGIPGTGGPEWLRNDWEPIICATKNGRLMWAEPTWEKRKPKQNHRRIATNRNKDGSRKQAVYKDPDATNPGNIIVCTVGSGNLGWEDAHKNEAPFPESLADFFVRSFCQPGGTVLDPFSGSGTTVAAAVKAGRNGVGLDIRESQVWLGETRLMGLTVAQRKSGQKMLV